MNDAIRQQLLRGGALPPTPQFQPTLNPQQIQQRASGIRGDNALGMALLSSGASSAQQPGKQLTSTNPDAYTLNAARQLQNQQYQQWQADNAASNSLQDRHQSNLNEQWRDRQMAMREEEARLRRAGESSDSWKGFTNSATKALTHHEGILRSIDDSVSGFKDEYQQVLGKYQSVFDKTPQQIVSLGVEGLVASTGIPARDAATIVESALWWSDLESKVFAKQRKELYGATLTNNELASWEAMKLITASASPAVIRARLQDMRAQAAQEADLYKNYAGAGSPEKQAFLDARFAPLLGDGAGEHNYDIVIPEEGGQVTLSGEQVRDLSGTQQQPAPAAPAVGLPTNQAGEVMLTDELLRELHENGG